MRIWYLCSVYVIDTYRKFIITKNISSIHKPQKNLCCWSDFIFVFVISAGASGSRYPFDLTISSIGTEGSGTLRSRGVDFILNTWKFSFFTLTPFQINSNCMLYLCHCDFQRGVESNPNHRLGVNPCQDRLNSQPMICVVCIVCNFIVLLSLSLKFFVLWMHFKLHELIDVFRCSSRRYLWRYADP